MFCQIFGQKLVKKFGQNLVKKFGQNLVKKFLKKKMLRNWYNIWDESLKWQVLRKYITVNSAFDALLKHSASGPCGVPME